MEPRESRGSGPKYKAQRGERSKCAPEESLKKNPCFAVAGFKARVAVRIGHSTVPARFLN